MPLKGSETTKKKEIPLFFKYLSGPKLDRYKVLFVGINNPTPHF